LNGADVPAPACHRGRQRIADTGLIDRQVAEGGDAPLAATVSVPLRVPPPWLVPMAMVTLEYPGHEVAELVQHLHGHRRSDGHAGYRVGRLHAESKVIRRGGVMLNPKDVAPPRLPSLAVRV